MKSNHPVLSGQISQIIISAAFRLSVKSNLHQFIFLSLMSWTKEFGGYIPGIYIVLHTFGSALKFNPHLHILITAGGLSLGS